MPKEREAGVELEFEEEGFLGEEGNPSPEFQEEEEFSILTEDEIEKGEPEPDPAAMQLQFMKEQMAALSAMQSQVGDKTGNKEMESLVKALSEMNKPKEPKWDPEVYKQKREEWAKNFYDKPLDIMDEWGQTMFGGVFQQMQDKMAKMERTINRQRLASDPKYGTVLEKYSSEVDEIANQFGNDPDAYKKASSMVAMNHLDEIIAEKLEAQLASQPETKPKERVSYTGTTKQPTPPQKKKNAIVLSAADKARFEREFQISPMPDRKSFYDLVWSRRQQSRKA